MVGYAVMLQNRSVPASQQLQHDQAQVIEKSALPWLLFPTTRLAGLASPLQPDVG